MKSPPRTTPAGALKQMRLGDLSHFICRGIGKSGQGLVRLGFFVEGLAEQHCSVVHPLHFCPTLERAVAGHLAMLDCLGR
jgi:hypothetical protein